MAEEMDAGSQASQQYKAKEPMVKLEGPLIFWIGFLIAAIVMQLVANTLLMPGSGASFKYLGGALAQISNYIIELPGILVFPFIVSLWIGERVSKSSTDSHKALHTSLINAAYASLIYGISIFVIFMLLNAPAINQLATLSSVITMVYTIFVPIGILFIFITVFSVLAFARRNR